MSSSTRLADLASKSGGILESAQIHIGTAWLSRRDVNSASSYEASVPMGLHIGLGVARMQTRAHGVGGFAASGPVLSVLDLTAGPADFHTALEAGRSRSFGVHIEPDLLGKTTPEAVLRLVETMNGQLLKTMQNGPFIKRVLPLLEPIDPWFQGSARDLVVEARALELIAVVDMWRSGQEIPTPYARFTRKVDAARDYIEAHLAENITLDIIARNVGVNVRTLSSAFRERFGVSVAAFVTDRRMQVAIGMLCEGAGVAEAAYAVGYQPNAFSVAFGRWFGFPPSAVRGTPKKVRAGLFPDREGESRDREEV